MTRKIIDFDGKEDKAFELKACPFCGKDIANFATCQQLQACKGFRECDDGHYLSVVCSMLDGGCGASTGFFPTFEAAARAWNRRHSVDPQEIIALVSDCTVGDLEKAAQGL